MDVRKRFPKGKSALIAINLKNSVWDYILLNPTIGFTEMEELKHRIIRLNKVIKKRTIPLKTALEIKRRKGCGVSIAELVKKYKLPKRVILKCIKMYN